MGSKRGSESREKGFTLSGTMVAMGIAAVLLTVGIAPIWQAWLPASGQASGQTGQAAQAASAVQPAQAAQAGTPVQAAPALAKAATASFAYHPSGFSPLAALTGASTDGAPIALHAPSDSGASADSDSAAAPETSDDQREGEAIALKLEDPDTAAGSDLKLEMGAVTVEGAMPAGTTGDAMDVSDDYEDLAATMPADGSLAADAADEGVLLSTIAAYGISLKADGQDYAPGPGNPVTVTIADEGIAQDKDLEVWRVAEDGAATEVDGAEVRDGAVSFEASADANAYLVVERTVLEQVLTASDGRTYGITVSFGADARIPAGARLSAVEVSGDEYFGYKEQARDAIGQGELAYMRAFDIAIVDAGGAKVEPAAPVDVSIALMDEAVRQDARVVHFPGSQADKVPEAGAPAPEVIEPAARAQADGLAFDFAADGFSVYAVAYTVDFHFGNYEFSIAGESSILLSEVFARLGVEANAADVASAVFSNPELVKVEQQGEDWLLTSLAPFDTEESLAVTMKNGQSFTIRVTDAAAKNGTVRNPKVVIKTAGKYDNGTGALVDNPVEIDSHLNFTLSRDGYAYASAKNSNAAGTRYYVPNTLTVDGYTYQVVGTTLTPGAITGRYLIFDDDLVLNMLDAAPLEYLAPVVDDMGKALQEQLTDDERAELEQFKKGASNGENGTPTKLFKNSTYDEATNSIIITLKYFQTMKKDVPLDFIFTLDDSGTMGSVAYNNATVDGKQYQFRATQSVWCRIVLQSVMQTIMEWDNNTADADYNPTGANSKGYKIRVAPIAFSSAAIKGEFSDTYQKAKDQISTIYTSGGTDHSKTIAAVKDLTVQSINAGNYPIVVYLSDFHSNANSAACKNAMKYFRTLTNKDGEQIPVYTVHMFENALRYDRNIASSNDKMYLLKDGEPIGKLLDVFDTITKDAIGYYVGKDTSVQDAVSPEIANIAKTPGNYVIADDPTTGNAKDPLVDKDGNGDLITRDGAYVLSQGQMKQNGANLSWTLTKTNGDMLPSGKLYTKTITIALRDDVVISPSVVSNSKAEVQKTIEDENGNVTVVSPSPNSIAESDQPKPKDGIRFWLGLLDENGSETDVPLVDTGEFELRKDSQDGTLVWGKGVNGGNGKTDSTGYIFIPSSSAPFDKGETYYLVQTATNADVSVSEMPFVWKLHVDETTGVVSSEGQGSTLAMTPKKGKYRIWNEPKVTDTAPLVKVQVTKTWDKAPSAGDKIAFTVLGNSVDSQGNVIGTVDLPAYKSADRTKDNFENTELVTELKYEDEGCGSNTTWSKTLYVPAYSGAATMSADNRTYFFNLAEGDYSDVTPKVGNDKRKAGGYAIREDSVNGVEIPEGETSVETDSGTWEIAPASDRQTTSEHLEYYIYEGVDSTQDISINRGDRAFYRLNFEKKSNTGVASEIADSIQIHFDYVDADGNTREAELDYKFRNSEKKYTIGTAIRHIYGILLPDSWTNINNIKIMKVNGKSQESSDYKNITLSKGDFGYHNYTNDDWNKAYATDNEILKTSEIGDNHWVVVGDYTEQYYYLYFDNHNALADRPQNAKEIKLQISYKTSNSNESRLAWVTLNLSSRKNFNDYAKNVYGIALPGDWIIDSKSIKKFAIEGVDKSFTDGAADNRLLYYLVQLHDADALWHTEGTYYWNLDSDISGEMLYVGDKAERKGPFYSNNNFTESFLSLTNTFTPSYNLAFTSSWTDGSVDEESINSIASVTYGITDSAGNAYGNPVTVPKGETGSVKVPAGAYTVKQLSYTLANGKEVPATEGAFDAFNTGSAAQTAMFSGAGGTTQTLAFDNSRKTFNVTVKADWVPDDTQYKDANGTLLDTLPYNVSYTEYVPDGDAYKAERKVLPGEVQKGSSWTGTKERIPVYGLDGSKTTCDATPDALDTLALHYTTDISSKQEDENYLFTITNTAKMAPVTITKGWFAVDADYAEPSSITVKVNYNGADYTPYAYQKIDGRMTLASIGTPEVALTADEGWTKTIYVPIDSYYSFEETKVGDAALANSGYRASYAVGAGDYSGSCGFTVSDETGVEISVKNFLDPARIKVKWVVQGEDGSFSPLDTANYADGVYEVHSDAFRFDVNGMYQAIGKDKNKTIVVDKYYFRHYGLGASTAEKAGDLNKDELSDFYLRNYEDGIHYSSTQQDAGDGELLSGMDTIYIIYSKEPPKGSTYLNFINNTPYTYSVNNLLGQYENGLVMITDSEGHLSMFDGVLKHITANETTKLVVLGGAGKDFNLNASPINTPDDFWSKEITATVSNPSKTLTLVNGKGLYNTKDYVTGTLLDEGQTVTVTFGVPAPICKIVNSGEEHPFYTLRDAVKYARESMGGTATIQMLVDYTMPLDDKVELASGENITLTTAAKSGGTHNYTGSGDVATITRGFDDLGSMFRVGGSGSAQASFATSNITLDGAGKCTAAGMEDANSQYGGIVEVYAGSLTVGGGSTLTNGKATNGGAVYARPGSTITVESGAAFTNNEAGKGGAVYVESDATISMSGGVITGGKADQGSAVYVVGSLTMSGGLISDNVSGNSSGAVDAANDGVKLTFSGNAVVHGNKGRDDTARNVYLGFDSNAIINAEALTEEALVGIRVADDIFADYGEMAKVFGSYTGEAKNLNSFVNDVRGYRGEMEAGNKIRWEYVPVPMVPVTVEKAWAGDVPENMKKPVPFTIYGQNGGSEYAVVAYDAEDVTAATTSEVKQLTAEDGWKKTVYVPSYIMNNGTEVHFEDESGVHYTIREDASAFPSSDGWKTPEITVLPEIVTPGEVIEANTEVEIPIDTYKSYPYTYYVEFNTKLISTTGIGFFKRDVYPTLNTIEIKFSHKQTPEDSYTLHLNVDSPMTTEGTRKYYVQFKSPVQYIANYKIDYIKINGQDGLAQNASLINYKQQSQMNVYTFVKTTLQTIKYTSKEEYQKPGKVEPMTLRMTNGLANVPVQPIVIHKDWAGSAPAEQVAANDSIAFTVKGVNASGFETVNAYAANTSRSAPVTTLSKDDTLNIASAPHVAGTGNAWTKLLYVPTEDSQGRPFTSYEVVEDTASLKVLNDAGVWDAASGYSTSNAQWVTHTEAGSYKTGYLRLAKNTVSNGDQFKSVDRMELYFIDHGDGDRHYHASVSFNGIVFKNTVTYYLEVPLPVNVDNSKLDLVIQYGSDKKHVFYTDEALTASGTYNGILLYSGDERIGVPKFIQEGKTDPNPTEGNKPAFTNVAFVDAPSGGQTIKATSSSLQVYSPGRLDVTNNWYICKIVDGNGVEHGFPTLHAAMDFARNPANGLVADGRITATIQMLVDYAIPSGDFLTDAYAVQDNESITLTTASKTEGTFRYTGGNEAAVITRGATGNSLIASSGSLTLTDIVMDGNRDRYSGTSEGGIVHAKGGTVTVTTGAVLKNSLVEGDNRGGAIRAESDTVVEINGGAQFLNCYSAHGGALHIGDDNKNPKLKITGAATIDHCDAWGCGGAIFLHRGQADIAPTGTDKVTISNCTARDYKGGAITVGYWDGSLKVSGAVEFVKCSSPSGGAIAIEGNANAKAEIGAGVEFRECSSIGNGGAIAVEAPADPSWQTSSLIMTGGAITDCKAAENGGGIAVMGENAKLEIRGTNDNNVQIAGSTAGKHGGGIFVWNEAKLDMDYATITGCKANPVKDNEDGGGAIAVVRDYEHSHTDAADAEIKHTTVTQCSSTGLAGGVFASRAYVKVSDSVFGKDGSAEDKNSGVYGGAIALAYSSKADVADTQIYGNEAGAGGGGALYAFLSEASLNGVTIKGCSTTAKGGALYLHTSTATLGGDSSVIGGSASRGSAVFADDNSTFNMASGKIRENVVSGTCGAVEAAETAKLNFSGNAVVYENTYTVDGKDQQKNVVLDWDTNGIINVPAAGLGSDAEIGVYVTGEPSGSESEDAESIVASQFDKHGVANAPFGTWVATTANLSGFKNDRNALTGIGYDGENNLVYWQDAAAYLKVENRTSLLPLYFKIIVDNGNYGDQIRKRGSDEQSPIKAKGATGSFYYLYEIGKAAEPAGASETLYLPNAGGKPYRIEVYRDKDMKQQIELLTDANITENEGSELYNTDAKAFAGTLKSGPRYKVKIAKDGTSDYLTTARKLQSGESYDKEDGGNSYNVATKNQNMHTLVSVKDAGFDVSFQKRDGYGEVLAGATFTIYTTAECTDIKKKGAEELTATSGGDGTVLFEKVPTGMWYMRENLTTKTGETWDSGAPEGYAPNENVYVVLVGDTALKAPSDDEERTGAWAADGVLANINKSNVEAQTGSDGKFAIFQLGANGKALATPDISAHGIANETSAKQRVILKKVGEGDAPLAGAHFKVFRSDFTEVTGKQGWVTGENGRTYYQSDATGAYFLADLSYGKYYILETKAPEADGYSGNGGKAFSLTVGAAGVDGPTLLAEGQDADTISKLRVQAQM